VTRTEVKDTLDRHVYMLRQLLWELQVGTPTPSAVKVATRIEDAIDLLRSARQDATIMTGVPK